MTTAVPDYLEEEDVDTLTLDDPVPYTLASSAPPLALPAGAPDVDAVTGPVDPPACELVADLVWLSVGRALTVQTLADGLVALGWQKPRTRP